MANPPISTLTLFRAQWATRFTDTCVIKRHVAGPGVLNQTTGVYATTFTTQYSGPCLVRPLSGSAVDAGQELVATHGLMVFVPYTEAGHLPEDLIDVTSATSADLTGRQFVITNVEFDTYDTVRKLICEDVTSG